MQGFCPPGWKGQEAAQRTVRHAGNHPQQGHQSSRPGALCWEPEHAGAAQQNGHHGGRLSPATTEATEEACLGRKTLASSLLLESSVSASPRADAPKPAGKGTWEMSDLQYRAEPRKGKQARDGRGLHTAQLTDSPKYSTCRRN